MLTAMQPMQLSPLQSRLAASLLASFLLILLYLSLFSPNFALAEELSRDGLTPPGLAVPLLPERDDSRLEAAEEEELSIRKRADEYEPEFNAFDRSLIGRVVPEGVAVLANNVLQSMTIAPGTSKTFVLEKAAILGRSGAERLELRRDLNGGGPPESPESLAERGDDGMEGELLERRQTAASKTVYISANTCIQPQPLADSTRMQAPQLTMYVSSVYTEALPQQPNTLDGTAPPNSTWHVFMEGAVMVNVSTSSDVFVRITAPTLDDDFSGSWDFEVAASLDGSYHQYSDSQDSSDLKFVDSDSKAALLQPLDAADSTMSQRPFVLFYRQGGDRAINGVRHSYCGLQKYAKTANTRSINTGLSIQARSTSSQEFHVTGLDSGSQYSGILARSTEKNAVGGGGLIYRSMEFTTRQANASNCEIITNLTFCNQVSYAVPSNSQTFNNNSKLASFYDDHAKEAYSFFEKSLAQIQCETDSTQKYSLVRNCTDCASAYKDWLCSVTIPRCVDFFTPGEWLWPRNMNQSFPDGRTLTDDQKNAAEQAVQAELSGGAATLKSRNHKIDETVQPGPYKELLPCENLCFDLVQSCPSSMGFSCPTSTSKHGFKGSYAVDNTTGGITRCNSPPNPHFKKSNAAALVPSRVVLVGGIGGVILMSGLALM